MGPRVHVGPGHGARAARPSPASALTTVGALRCGAAATAAANFPENSPNRACALCRVINENSATSQNSVEPPLPSTTS